MEWLKNIWNDIVGFFQNNGWKVFAVVATLIFGVILIKILLNISRRLLNKTKMEKIAMQFFMTILKFVLYLVLILVLLSMIGIQVTGIITAFSAVILAVGMALQSSIANLANGIIIIATKMFKKGDYISVCGVEGSIQDINFLFVTLTTPDNKKITLPNSDIVNNAVTNFGAHSTRRVQFTFSVAYESDVELVKKVVIDTMKSNGKVYLDKDLFCSLKEMSASSLDFFAYCWCDSEDYWNVYYYIMENVYNEFKRNNISVPYNQLEVRNRVDKVKVPVIGKSLPERVEKERKKEDDLDLETADLKKFFSHEVNKFKAKKKQKETKIEKKAEEKANKEDKKN